MALSVPNEGYSRNASCALNFFLFYFYMDGVFEFFANF